MPRSQCPVLKKVMLISGGFSLMRDSTLESDDYLDAFYDTGRERQLRYFDGRRARQNVRGTARQAGDGT